MKLTDGTILTRDHLPHPYEFALVVKTRDYETDSQGIVNNANYLHYLELTRHAYCESRGYSFGDMTADGIVAVLRRAEIDYIRPLHGNQLFVSCLWVERKGPRFVFHQDLFLPSESEGSPVDLDAVVARAQTTVVATRDGHLTKGDELADRLDIHS